MTKQAAERVKEPTAADLMSGPVECVYVSDTIERVARLFAGRHISGAPVIGRAGRPIGVITKSDLSRYEAVRRRLVTDSRQVPAVMRYGPYRPLTHGGFHADPEAETIEEWITPDLHCVAPADLLSRVVHEMLRHHVHHIFVMERPSHQIVGVVTSYDLVRYLAKRLP